MTAFISYKDFADELGDMLTDFDILTHFDRVAGLNFDSLEYLVVFGYPKVRHEVVIDVARVQYANAKDPLPEGDYEALTTENTFTDDGISITERRYKDPRLESIRHRLSTDKLIQALGRIRLPRWEDTTTVLFTNAPIPSITERATLFTSDAFNIATSAADLPKAQERIDTAIETGDVKAVMEVKGVSQRTAYKETSATRKLNKAERDAEICRRYAEGQSKKQIATDMSIGQATVKRVLETRQKGGSPKLQPTISTLIGMCKNGDPRVKPDNPCVQNLSNGKSQNGASAHSPVPQTEYSKLTECQARIELQYCEGNDNYSGAAYLRNLFKSKGWELTR